MKDKTIPYRVDIAGSWADHPFINAVSPASVICAKITGNFKKGMGLSGSTRETIKKYKNKSLEYLFLVENEGKSFMTGSQDLLGIMIPGVKMLKYDQSYWPDMTATEYLTKQQAQYLEKVLYLIPTFERAKDLNVIGRIDVTKMKAKEFGKSTQRVWEYIKEMNTKRLGEEMERWKNNDKSRDKKQKEEQRRS